MKVSVAKKLDLSIFTTSHAAYIDRRKRNWIFKKKLSLEVLVSRNFS